MLNLRYKQPIMKKVATMTLMGIKALILYYIVVVDRFAMSLFVGVDLPSFYKPKLKITEDTTDEQIEQSVIDEDQHEIDYQKIYIPKARRRAYKTTILILTYYLFTILSYRTLILTYGTAILIAAIYLLVKRLLKRNTKT